MFQLLFLCKTFLYYFIVFIVFILLFYIFYSFAIQKITDINHSKYENVIICQ